MQARDLTQPIIKIKIESLKAEIGLYESDIKETCLKAQTLLE